jgi:LmbE family N-acetylglucosaminyl deacetylase
MTDQEQLIKQREICFHLFHPDHHQVKTAVKLLTGLDGIEQVAALDEQCMMVRYDIRQWTLQLIDETLTELGFHIRLDLLARIKRALYYYTEDVQRENLGCSKGQSNCTREVFIKRYESIRHGCRDERPDHWRRYL